MADPPDQEPVNAGRTVEVADSQSSEVAASQMPDVILSMGELDGSKPSGIAASQMPDAAFDMGKVDGSEPAETSGVETSDKTMNMEGVDKSKPSETPFAATSDTNVNVERAAGSEMPACSNIHPDLMDCDAPPAVDNQQPPLATVPDESEEATFKTVKDFLDNDAAADHYEANFPAPESTAADTIFGPLHDFKPTAAFDSAVEGWVDAGTDAYGDEQRNFIYTDQMITNDNFDFNRSNFSTNEIDPRLHQPDLNNGNGNSLCEGLPADNNPNPQHVFLDSDTHMPLDAGEENPPMPPCDASTCGNAAQQDDTPMADIDPVPKEHLMGDAAKDGDLSGAPTNPPRSAHVKDATAEDGVDLDKPPPEQFTDTGADSNIAQDTESANNGNSELPRNLPRSAKAKIRTKSRSEQDDLFTQGSDMSDSGNGDPEVTGFLNRIKQFNEKKNSTPKSGPRRTANKKRGNKNTNTKAGAKPKGITKTAARKLQKKNNVINYNLQASNFFSQDNTLEDHGPMFEGAEDVKAALHQIENAASPEDRNLVKTDVSQLRAAIASLTGKDCIKPTNDGKWALTGMISHLDHYQVVGVGTMRLIEKKAYRDRVAVPRTAPRGGLLADEMGLGKTVMALAAVINAKPKKGKPTLIVCPASVRGQWTREIRKHVESQYCNSIMTYKGSSVSSLEIKDEHISEVPFVIATYDEVRNSYPKPPTPYKKEEGWDEWKNSNTFSHRKGQLHRIGWERVILDEAQQIKNYNTATSRACVALEASYYWALSGTPCPNSPLEFYPYFKLCRAPYSNSFENFKQHLFPSNSTVLLKQSLETFMIRRTQASKFLGRPILDLPKSIEKTISIPLSRLERQVYEIVEKRFKARVNNMVRSNAKGSQYSNILTLVLRLRQLTTHALLIHDTLSDLIEESDRQRLRKLISTYTPQQENDRKLLPALRKLINDAVDKRPMEDDKELLDGLETEPSEDSEDFGGAFGQRNTFGNYIDAAETEKHQDEESNGPPLCTKCRNAPGDPMYMACGCCYCGLCYVEMVQQSTKSGESRTACYKCGYGYQDPAQTKPKPKPNAAPIYHGRPAATNRCQGLIDRWINDRGDMLPSSKMLAIKAQLLNWLKADSEVKIIIFSQFITTLLILEKMAEIEGWSSRTYLGELSQKARDKIIEDFKSDDKVQLLFMALKSGGLGLNLAEASKVILVESWWNTAVELQAFCRIRRRGQKKETENVKFIVSKTIDERIANIQRDKDIDINAVYQGVSKKLSMADLIGLFGNVEEKDGKILLVDEAEDSMDED